MPRAMTILGSGSSSIHLDTSGLDSLIANLGDELDKVPKAVAFEVEAKAKMLAPVDTGALKNSIHVVTDDFSSFGAVSVSNVPVHEIDKPMEPYIARVGPGVEYAAYVEFGTSRMGAQPYLFPAMEAAEKELVYYVRRAFKAAL